MADFYQTASIATLHRLGQDNLRLIENELLEYRNNNPIALSCHACTPNCKGPRWVGSSSISSTSPI